MASAKQVTANRQNALKSTGPKNTQTVRFNALRHGLRAKILILPDEEAAEFNSLLQDLETEWQPQTPTQFIQVERMAVNYWKLARADRREAFFRLNDMPDRFVDQSFKFQQGFERAFDRAQQALERMQTNRCAAPAKDSLAPEPEPIAMEPPAVEPMEVQRHRPDEPAEAPTSEATPSFPPDLPPHQRRYFRRQAAADEKREKQLMRDGFLRPADYRYYPTNPLIPRAKTPSAPESPTFETTQSSMRALPTSSTNFGPDRRRQAPPFSLFRYTTTTRTEDRATLESDPSADPAAGIGAGAELPPIRFSGLQPILAPKR